MVKIGQFVKSEEKMTDIANEFHFLFALFMWNCTGFDFEERHILIYNLLVMHRD